MLKTKQLAPLNEPKKEQPLPFSSPGADEYKNYVIMAQPMSKPGEYIFTRFLNSDMPQLEAIKKTLPADTTTKFVQVVQDGEIQPLDNKSTALYILSVADKAKTARALMPTVIPPLSFMPVPEAAAKPANLAAILDIPHFTTKYTGADAHHVSEAVTGGFMVDLLIDRAKESGIDPYVVQENAAINDKIRASAISGDLPDYAGYNMQVRAAAVNDLASSLSAKDTPAISIHFDGDSNPDNHGAMVLPSKHPLAKLLATDIIEQTQKRGGISIRSDANRAPATPADVGVRYDNPTGLQNYVDGPFVLIERGNSSNSDDVRNLLSSSDTVKETDAIAGALIEYKLAVSPNNSPEKTPAESIIAEEMPAQNITAPAYPSPFGNLFAVNSTPSNNTQKQTLSDAEILKNNNVTYTPQESTHEPKPHHTPERHAPAHKSSRSAHRRHRH